MLDTSAINYWRRLMWLITDETWIQLFNYCNVSYETSDVPSKYESLVQRDIALKKKEQLILCATEFIYGL